MKKFVFLYYGNGDGNPDAMEAWGAWFASIGGNLIDPGNPFAEGRDVSRGASAELRDSLPITGYSIVSAESFEAAEKLLDGMPAIDGVRIYEALPM